jgi:hypothetical protein
MKIYTLVAMMAILPICAIADDREVTLKLTSVKFDYAETNAGKLFNTEKSGLGKIKGFELTAGSGSLSGVQSGMYQNMNLIYNTGGTDYVGSLQGGTFGDITNTTNNRIYDFSWVLGARAAVAKNFALGAEAGIGYRNWLRQLQGTGGYDEVYYWGYWTAGINAKFLATEKTTFFANYNLSKAINPKMHAGLAGGIDFALGNTNGNKYSFGADYKLDKSWSFVGEYEYENWDITKSNTVSLSGSRIAYEPDSKTKNQIAKIGFKKSW